MKNEKPIIMSTPMVQGIQEDRKTQTRRIKGLDFINENPDKWEFINTSDKLDFPRPADCKYPENVWYYWNNVHNNSRSFISQCPYGKPGDVLWVRETWAKTGDNFHDDWPGHGEYYYRADDPYSELEPNSPTKGLPKWKPSIFMPKEACRIKLLVKDIRVERLQDISEQDAIAEGIQTLCDPKISETGSGQKFYNEGDYPTDHYERLWESINGKDSWNKNPWVWVVTFKRI